MSPTSPTRQSILDALYMESLALENPFAFQDSYHLADFAPWKAKILSPRPITQCSNVRQTHMA